MEMEVKAALLDGLMNNEQMKEEFPQLLQAIKNAYDEICLTYYIFEKTALQ